MVRLCQDTVRTRLLPESVCETLHQRLLGAHHHQIHRLRRRELDQTGHVVRCDGHVLAAAALRAQQEGAVVAGAHEECGHEWTQQQRLRQCVLAAPGPDHQHLVLQLQGEGARKNGLRQALVVL